MIDFVSTDNMNMLFMVQTRQINSADHKYCTKTPQQYELCFVKSVAYSNIDHHFNMCLYIYFCIDIYVKGRQLRRSGLVYRKHLEKYCGLNICCQCQLL